MLMVEAAQNPGWRTTGFHQWFMATGERSRCGCWWLSSAGPASVNHSLIKKKREKHTTICSHELLRPSISWLPSLFPVRARVNRRCSSGQHTYHPILLHAQLLITLSLVEEPDSKALVFARRPRFSQTRQDALICCILLTSNWKAYLFQSVDCSETKGACKQSSWLIPPSLWANDIFRKILVPD